MISDFSVKKPFTVAVAIILVLILGVVSYTKMTIDLIPSINLPYAVVITTYIGASPEQVETAVTDTLEQTLASVNNMKQLRSISSENMSIIILEFNDDTNMDSALLEMRENLDMITAYFPEEIGNPMIVKINPDMMPVEIMSVSAEGMSDAEAAVLIEEKIIPEIKSVEGVASATATGLIENMHDVVINEEKIDALNDKINDYVQSEIDKTVAEQVDIIYEEQMAAAEEQMAQLALFPPEQLAALGSDAEMPSEEELRQSIEEEIRKQLPETEPAEIDITEDMISGILSAQSFSMPAGTVYTADGYSTLVRVGDKYSSAEELKAQVLFAVDGYGDVTLSDVAEVISYDNTSTIYSRVNGDYAIMLALQKQPNYSTADVTNSVTEKLDEIRAEYPNADFTILMNQGDYVNAMIESVVKNLLIGAALAIVILIIFLRRIRPTVIVGLSIVISVISAFVLMYFAGISLNVISMGGLALGVGMLVDNSIVVIENIFRMRSEGRTAREAAVEGAKEVAGAITASTLTTIVVFVPIIFTSGITRQLFTDMALTIGFSLVASLAVALTLVPAMSSRMLEKGMDNAKESKLSEAYSKLLDKSLRHNAVAIILAVALLGGSIFAAVSSGAVLFPAMDSGSISISVSVPETYTREEAFSALDELNDIIASVQDIKTVGIMDTSGSASAESALLSMASSSGTTVYVLLDENRTSTTDEIMEQLRTALDEAQLGIDVAVSAAAADLSMLSGSAVEINVFGRELDDIRNTAARIAEIVEETDGTAEVSSGLAAISDELRVIVSKEEAARRGLTTAQVYLAVSEAAAADKSALSFTQDGLEYSVFIKDDRSEKVTAETLGDIEVVSQTGEAVKVSEVAELVHADGFSSINRSNQERFVSVTAKLEGGYDVTEVNSQLEEKLEALELPAGVRYKISGESEVIRDTFSDLALMLLLAIVFIYLVMVAQFQSLLSPFIVMFTIPLAFTGGFGAMFLTGTPVSVISIIGLVVLVGVVVNNGIVFVDYANKQVEKGMDVRDALILTGRHRLRPILMTALTTIIALVAMAFDTSSGSELLKPMAVTTIGGMVYSTLLTLFLIPAMYTIFHRKKKAAEGEK